MNCGNCRYSHVILRSLKDSSAYNRLNPFNRQANDFRPATIMLALDDSEFTPQRIIRSNRHHRIWQRHNSNMNQQIRTWSAYKWTAIENNTWRTYETKAWKLRKRVNLNYIVYSAFWSLARNSNNSSSASLNVSIASANLNLVASSFSLASSRTPSAR